MPYTTRSKTHAATDEKQYSENIGEITSSFSFNILQWPKCDDANCGDCSVKYQEEMVLDNAENFGEDTSPDDLNISPSLQSEELDCVDHEVAEEDVSAEKERISRSYSLTTSPCLLSKDANCVIDDELYYQSNKDLSNSSSQSLQCTQQDIGEDISTIKPIITQPSTLTSFPSMKCEKVSECECTSYWTDWDCIEKAIFLWHPEHFLICGACYWNETDALAHDCLMWEKYEISLQQRAWDVLTDTENLYELFEIYCNMHQLVPLHLQLLKNFKLGMRSLLKRKIHRIVHQLLEKDQEGWQNISH